MAESLTIARPYAEAAFKLARDANSLPQWSDALSRLAAVAGNRVAHDLIGNPRVTDDQLAALVADVAGSLSPEQRNFVQLLAENERLNVIATLQAKYGRKVKADVHVDPELIGGISIRIGDEVHDTSVRGKLAQLADALMK
jgi:F-type H+-transporting ATPase subunit delta